MRQCRSRDALLRIRWVGQVDREHVNCRARLADGVLEAIAAQVECGVAYFLVDAQRMFDAGGAHLCAATLAGFELGLADVREDAQALGHVTARVDRDDRNARGDRAFDGRPKRICIRDRHDQAVWIRGHRSIDEL